MKRFKKAIALLLMLIIIPTLCVSGAVSGALELEIEAKFVPDAGEQQPKPHSELEDGEVYAYTKITGDPLPSPEFTVDLAAIGQQFRVESVISRRYNIVLLLDVSNSMEGTRMTNMIEAANDAAQALVGNGNKIAAVSFATGTDEERHLSEKAIEFYGEGTKTSTTTKDYVKIGLRKDRSQGGTNIQRALREGYTILSQANDPAAVPVIILLSDGAPTYYLTDVDNPYSSSSGAGSASGAANTAYTIAEAAYMKVLMPNLQIFTIPFALDRGDSDTKYANATLNPTDANLALVSGFESEWSNALRTVDSQYRSQMSKEYVTASYSADDSAASLSAALQSAIVHMQGYNPITETTERGKLTDTSYLWARYQIGEGFTLAGDTMTVVYNGTNYTFKRVGDDFVYQPSGVSNSKMEKLQLKVTDTGLVEWKVPASVLPSIPAGGDAQYPVDPIVLRFKLAFDINAEGLKAETYPTSTSCVYTFWPTAESPYYYSGDTTVQSFNPRQYYAVQLQPSNINNQPSFATADETEDLESRFVALGSASFERCDTSDGVPTFARIRYAGSVHEFSQFTQLEATADFVYSGRSFSSTLQNYSVSNFRDGYGREFNDARVTSVANVSTSRKEADVAVSYNYVNGQPRHSVVFKSLQFAQVIDEVSVTADIERETYIEWVIIIPITKVRYKVNWIQEGQNKVYTNITASYSSGTVTFTHNGYDYRFTDVNLSGNSTDTFHGNKYVSQDRFAASKTQPYFYAQYDVITPASCSFTVSGNTLTVAVNNALEAKYIQSDKVQFDRNNYGGYTVTVDEGEVSRKITYVVSGVLVSKTVRTYTAQNGIDYATGKVTLESNPVGYIQLKNPAKAAEEVAQEVGAAVTLTSTYNSAYTTAFRRNVAQVYLNVTVTERIDNLAFKLDTSDSGLLKNATVERFDVKSGGGYTTIDSAIPSSIDPGEYRILYRVEFNTPTPSATMLRFNEMTFKWQGYDGLLIHSPDYTNQQVRVSFDTTMGH
jgi:uncharacterized protein YegL